MGSDYQLLGESNPIWESWIIGVKEALKEVTSKLNSEGQAGVNQETRKKQCGQMKGRIPLVLGWDADGEVKSPS